MEFYFYFINLDNNYVKFGITKNIIERLSNHKQKFITELKLKKKLTILKILKIKNEFINKKCERMIKEYIKYKDQYIKIYEHTEIFPLWKLDSYIRMIKENNQHYIKYLKIENNNDNNYQEINIEEIEHIKKKLDINYTTFHCSNFDNITGHIYFKDVISNILNNEKFCFRCAKRFSCMEKLKIHLNKQKICDIEYINISADKIIENYYNYVHHFSSILRGSIPKGVIVCDYCDFYFNNYIEYNRHIKLGCDNDDIRKCQYDILSNKKINENINFYRRKLNLNLYINLNKYTYDVIINDNDDNDNDDNDISDNDNNKISPENELTENIDEENINDDIVNFHNETN